MKVRDHPRDEQWIAYAQYSLTDAERETLDRHLVECTECRQRLAGHVAFGRRLHYDLRADLQAVRPSRHMRFASVAPRLMRTRRVEMFRLQSRRVVSAVGLLAAVAILAYALSGILASRTSRPAPAGTEISITFACRDYQRDWYQNLADEFSKIHPGIAVHIVSTDEITGQKAGSSTVISSDDTAKVAHAADAFVDSPLMLGTRPQDIVLDLTEMAGHDTSFVVDDFLPGALALFQNDGRLWGLPTEVHSLLIFYNRGLFDQAGVPYPQIGWSWADFMDAAIRLTIREGDRIKQYGYVDPWTRYTLPSLAHQKAGPLITYEHEIPLAHLDDQSVVGTVQWYASLVSTYAVMLDPLTIEYTELQRYPYEHSLAMWAGFSWDLDNFRDTGIVPLPEAGEPAVPISANGYFVSAGTMHREAAWRWITFLSEQPLYRYSSGTPARKSVLQKTRYWKQLDPSVAAVLQYNLEHAVGYPGVIGSGLKRAFEQVLQGARVEEALAEVQSSVNDRLAEMASETQQPPAKFVVAGPMPTPTPGGTQIHFRAPADGDVEVYRALVDRFHRDHPGIAVQVEAAPISSLADQASAVDCFVGYAELLQAEEPNNVLSLNPLIAEDPRVLDAFYPTFLQRMQIAGEIRGLPLDADAQLLYYSRSLFDRLGAPYPTGRWTPQQLVEQAVALTTAGAPEPVYGFYPRDGAYRSAADYVAWLGGKLFDAANRSTFDDPTVIAAAKRYVELILSGGPPMTEERPEDRLSGVTSTTWGIHPGSVAAGNVAMWSDWYGNHRLSPALGFEVGIAPLPAGAAQLESPTLRALFISAQASDPQACWAWIVFVSAQPEASSRLAVRRDIAANDTWRNAVGAETADAWLSIQSREPSSQSLWAYSPTAYLALYWFDQAISEALSGTPPATALAAVQVKAAAFVDCTIGQEGEEAWRTCARQADPDAVLPAGD